MLGMLPMLRSRQTDPVAIVQLALIGTVLHIFCTIFIAAALLFFHVENMHGSFIFWLLGAYWVSLVLLVWQLRRIIMNLIPAPKVQN